MGQFLKIVGEAGKDEKSRALVHFVCSRCSRRGIMRRDKVKRNKSCGCLRADRWHEMLAKKKPKLVERRNNPFWEQYCNKGLGPAQIIANARKSGVLYQPDLTFLVASPVVGKSAMESLTETFTSEALKRAEYLSTEEFDLLVKESHAIIDRRTARPRKGETA